MNSHQKDVFVIMPFSTTASQSEEEWTEIFEHVFKPAAITAGYQCRRAQPKTGSLIRSIVSDLNNSWIVLADITDQNPNVFYELGVRHSLSKRTIICSQDAKFIPSDLKGYWSILYGTRPAQVRDFQAKLADIFSSIEEDPAQSDNPVSDYLAATNSILQQEESRQNTKKLSALLTELSGISLAIENFNPEYPLDEIASTECISLLLQTLYVDPGSDALRDAYELLKLIRNYRRGVIDPKGKSEGKSRVVRLQDALRRIIHEIHSGTYKEPSTMSSLAWVETTGHAKCASKTNRKIDCASYAWGVCECVNVLYDHQTKLGSTTQKCVVCHQDFTKIYTSGTAGELICVKCQNRAGRKKS